MRNEKLVSRASIISHDFAPQLNSARVRTEVPYLRPLCSSPLQPPNPFRVKIDEDFQLEPKGTQSTLCPARVCSMRLVFQVTLSQQSFASKVWPEGLLVRVLIESGNWTEKTMGFLGESTAARRGYRIGLRPPLVRGNSGVKLVPLHWSWRVTPTAQGVHRSLSWTQKLKSVREAENIGEQNTKRGLIDLTPIGYSSFHQRRIYPLHAHVHCCSFEVSATPRLDST